MTSNIVFEILKYGNWSGPGWTAGRKARDYGDKQYKLTDDDYDNYVAKSHDLNEVEAEDTLNRNRIIAPVSGTVVNTQIFTRGGVIAPAQPILDIVPANDRMLIEAQVAPNDIDIVHAGLTAEVRISVFKQAEAPTLDGVVQTVSADALTDEATGMPYYLARILIHDLSDLPRDAELQPGMPAEVMIVTGEQTAIEYLTEPIRLSLRRAMKEG